MPTKKPVKRVRKPVVRTGEESKTARKKVTVKKSVAKKPVTKSTKSTAKKSASKPKRVQSQKSDLPKKGENLSEFNPYDKKEYPKHHAIAAMLLAGKRVAYAELYNKTGLSPRTLAQVLADLDSSNIEVIIHRDSDRKNSYTVKSKGRGAKKRQATPLAA